MCGRFTLQSPVDDLRDLFRVDDVPELVPRYNVAPTQDVPVVRLARDEPVREVAITRWGLVPFFMKDTKSAARMINARSETVAEKPSFREAFKKRRCLVPADGFIEWEKRADGKQPWLIGMAGGGLFSMAGLWERWRGPDGPVETCTILTTAANDLVGKIHDRMPVILEAGDFELWLDRGTSSRAALEPLLAPFDADAMSMRPVDRRVNNARNDDPDCLRGPDPGLFD